MCARYIKNILENGTMILKGTEILCPPILSVHWTDPCHVGLPQILLTINISSLTRCMLLVPTCAITPSLIWMNPLVILVFRCLSPPYSLLYIFNTKFPFSSIKSSDAIGKSAHAKAIHVSWDNTLSILSNAATCFIICNLPDLVHNWPPTAH